MGDATLIDWELAERVARGMAGTGTGKRSVRTPDIRRAARGSVGAVSDYTGLEPRRRSPSPELLDRPEWIQANVASLRSMLATVEDQIAGSLGLPDPLGSGLRRAAGMAVGVEVGVASGFLAQRVLGQYDVALVGPSRPARLLFIAPNLADARTRLGVDREPFLRWIALHEATHVVQFGAVPWLREHVGGMGQELMTGAFTSVSLGEVARSARGFLTTDPRRLVGAIRGGRWLDPVIGSEQRKLMDRLQATMAVVEGYSEHVMDEIGEQIGPAFPRMRAQMEARRSRRRSPLEAILSKLLGLDQKMLQYRQGKAFCDEVVDRRDIETLNLVWSEPSALPSSAELVDPGRWLRRVA